MAYIGGTREEKTYVGEFDFAVDGGAVSTITLRSNTGAIPNGSVVTRGFLQVTTGFTTSASGQAAISVEGAADTVAAAVVSGAPWSTTGVKSIIPASTGATAIATTADRSPAIVISVGAITAGKCRVVLFYI